MKIRKPGFGYWCAEGKNGRLGTIQLSCGRARIDWHFDAHNPYTEISSKARVFFTISTPRNPGFISYYIEPNCYIDVFSTNPSDCSVLDYFIVEGIDAPRP